MRRGACRGRYGRGGVVVGEGGGVEKEYAETTSELVVHTPLRKQTGIGCRDSHEPTPATALHV
jgi:hypothetical protein